MLRPLSLGAALALVLACRPSPPEAHPPEHPSTAVTSSEEQADTTPPADVSHGEAPIGGPAAQPGPRLPRTGPPHGQRPRGGPAGGAGAETRPTGTSRAESPASDPPRDEARADRDRAGR